MKKWLLYIVLFLFVFAGCVHEPSEKPSAAGEVDCVLSFGSPQGMSVDVTTRGELGIVRESNVFNIYLMIFEGNSASSKKIYGHYFDSGNLNATSESNYWTVTNMSAANDPATNGTIHFRTSAKTGCTLVAVANMNPNDLDVSAGLLSTIQTFGDLQGVVATQVRSEIAANSGFFLMTGQIDGVDIVADNEHPDDPVSISPGLSLSRLYAKVTFNVRVAKNPDPSKSASLVRSFVPYKWKVVNVPTCAYLLERDGDDAADTPEELFETEELGFETETLTSDANDFYSDGVTKVSIHSFSFYMMENRHAPSDGITTYADRERREKPDPYTATTFFDNGGYVYTDPLSAYVVLTGKIVMGTTATVGEGVNAHTNENATLDANVRYEIHLGNFSSDVTDFNTERNYNYVYNIYIGGAESIKAEVEAYKNGSIEEPEPGATGRVVVALEKVFDSDCHYSTQVISFHANYMDPNNISWYVESPFNPDGVGGSDVSSGLVSLSDIDYHWVEFFVNAKDDSGVYYSDRRVKYYPYDYDGPEFHELNGDPIPHGDPRRTMYVDELVSFLRSEKVQYDIDRAKMALEPGDPGYDPDYVPQHHFDNDPGPDGPKISVTAFIDEYYYTVHPITKEYDPTLWKQIVNHPMRRMHILASSATSADKESTMIGSSFTIQQRSIQSIYAVHETAGLQSAWGMEFTDDNNETGLADYWKNENFEDCGNTSTTNGRLNTLKLWGVLDKDGNENAVGERWDKYLNLYGTNETPHLWDKNDPENPNPAVNDYNYLRYSCLSRNRDNDGDGIIDADEIRWYMAADVQLIGVFMGSYGIEGDARLYQRSAADQANSNKDKWRQHVIASNRYVNTEADSLNSNKYARVVWAEEGANGSSLAVKDKNLQTSKFGTRCVRNLGYYVEGGERKDITLTDNPNVEPDPYIIMTRKRLNEDGTVTSPYTGNYDDRTFYEFDCSRINVASLRDPVDHELIGHDENSKMACLSSKFVTAPVINLVDLNSKGSYSFNNKTYNLKQIQSLNRYLDDSFPDLDANFSVCPEGYRLPNVREISIIWTALSPLETGDGTEAGYLGSNGTNMPARTHWSKGVEGTMLKVNNAWGWAMNSKHLLMANTGNGVSKPRCVKDL